MAYALSPHVHLAVLGEDVVLLDTAADAYLCVPDGAAHLRPAPDRSALAPQDEAVVAALLEAGLIRRSADAAARATLPRPSHDIGEAGSDPLTLGDVWRLSGALWDLVWRYRGHRLGEILAFVSAAPCAPPEVATPDVVRLARRFQRAVVWLPMPRKCLVRSFVLLRFLQRSGLNARWVFGVTTWPFRAHCWLQVADMALDDNAERIVEYEPILGVG